jgi:hypothetical protein
MRRQSIEEEESRNTNAGGQEHAPLVRNSDRSDRASLRLMGNDDLNRPSIQGVTRPNLTYGEALGENTLIHGNDVKERVRKIKQYPPSILGREMSMVYEAVHRRNGHPRPA